MVTFIREEQRNYVSHDQLFKELISHFFEEFMDVFFPAVHANIDFESISPLSEELFTDLIKGDNRRVDIVIEARLKETDTLIVVHVEPQSSYQKDFHERMYLYFSLLYNKYRKPILPIAVFSYDEQRTEQNQFTVGFPFFHVLTYNFLMLELKKKNWRDYLESNNPVAAALLGKMGYKEEEKVQVKLEFLRMMLKMELNPARARFINDFFEQYLKLNTEEEEELMQEISRLDNAEEFIKLPNSWEERGIRKGIQQGKEAVIIKMLAEGFSIDTIAKVTEMDRNEIEKLQKMN
ncbi:transposase [Sporosarcina sp. HYO08]|nr:transposase [Sporosarcina sp. HYO08]